MKTTYPDGLLQIKMAGVPFLGEYKGIEKAHCIVCGRDSMCHTFRMITDIENYPNYTTYTTFHFGETHAQRYVKVIGAATISKV